MNTTKEIYKKSFQYIKTFLKWIFIATVVGIIGGIVGSVFHKCLDYVTDLRMNNSYITYFMPLGVLVIVAMYNTFCNKGTLDTNLIITSVRKEEEIPFIIVPFIFLGTVITQLFGGSAGREGAALQLGGGIGYNLGKIFKLNKNDIHIITMAGMSSVFSALFGTPVTAAIFSLEVISVGAFNFTGLLPCLLASVTAYCISTLFGISGESVAIKIEPISTVMILKVILLAICCALISILFCVTIKKWGCFMKRYFKNPYLRGIVGASLVVLLTVASGTFDYNGAGMNIVERALSGETGAYDFIMKIIFTAITIAAGFKGGEIVPAFFVGATFGCVIGPILGIGSGFAAAIGMVAVFCGVVNCPISSIILSVEMFGADGLALFGIACAVSYILSGHSGLYKSQNILYSKITADIVND
ncbi:MAG: chloride channel protein [Clostridia bacterium]|nr:chloride channel protein [Clostridia bacterium]